MGSNKNKKLVCKIVNIEDDPIHKGRKIVSIKIDDGDNDKGPYIRAYSLIPPENPISLEKFSIDLARKDLSRPIDGFHFLNQAQKDETKFEVLIETESGS